MTVFLFDATERRHTMRALRDKIVDLMELPERPRFRSDDCILFHWTHLHDEWPDEDLQNGSPDDGEVDPLTDRNRFLSLLAVIRPLVQRPSGERPSIVFYSGLSEGTLPTHGPRRVHDRYPSVDDKKLTFFHESIPRAGEGVAGLLLQAAGLLPDIRTSSTGADDFACGLLILDALVDVFANPENPPEPLATELVAALREIALGDTPPLEVKADTFQLVREAVTMARSFDGKSLGSFSRWILKDAAGRITSLAAD